MADEKENKNNAKGSSRGVRIRVLDAVIVLLTTIVSIVFLQAVHDTNETYLQLQSASETYIQCENAANDLKAGTNYLTIQVRRFVVTKDVEYMDNYFQEVNDTKRRQQALDQFEELDGGQSQYLRSALADSNSLMDIELYAMKLVVEAEGYTIGEKAAALRDVELSARDAALSREEKVDLATDYVFGDVYTAYVERIESNIVKCKDGLVKDVEVVQTQNSETLRGLLFRQQLFTGIMFAVVIAMVLSIVILILWPLRVYIDRINSNEPLPHTGAHELRYLAESYNQMYEENMKNHDALRRKAEHDHLTGLYNRSAFERLLEVYSDEPYALLLIDADYFKNINDTLGHDGGDAMLQKISTLLGKAFRATDYPCRIGGDEFAVIMTEVDESLRHVVSAKIQSVVDGLLDTSDGLPAMTLSIGVSFNDGTLDAETMFKNADQALYHVKEEGRNGHKFYEPEGE